MSETEKKVTGEGSVDVKIVAEIIIKVTEYLLNGYDKATIIAIADEVTRQIGEKH